MEASGHTVFIVKKQGDINAGDQFPFSYLLQSRIPAHGMVLSTLVWV